MMAKSQLQLSVLLLLLLAAAGRCAGLQLWPDNSLDTHAIQFRAVHQARIVTDVIPVSVVVPLPANPYAVAAAARKCSVSIMAVHFASTAKRWCAASQSLREAFRLIVDETLTQFESLGGNATAAAPPKPTRHHADAWRERVHTIAKEEAVEDVEFADLTTARAQMAMVSQFVDSLAQFVRGETTATLKLEPGTLSSDVATRLSNVSATIVGLMQEAPQQAPGNGSSDTLPADLDRRLDDFHYRVYKDTVVRNMLEKLDAFRIYYKDLQSALNSCEDTSLPFAVTPKFIELYREAERSIANATVQIVPIHAASVVYAGGLVLGFPPDIIQIPHHIDKCTVLRNASLAIEYSLPVRRTQPAWHLFNATPVPFLLNGLHCSLLHGEVLFATDGATDVRDLTGVAAVAGDAYVLPRHAPRSDVSRCLRALVLARGADDAALACPLTCRPADGHAAVRRLNRTTFAVTNPTAAASVLCGADGSLSARLPRLASGRHEVTLPCECSVRLDDAQRTELVSRGALCGVGGSAGPALAVDSRWTDGNFTAARLFTTQGDAAAPATVPLRFAASGTGNATATTAPIPEASGLARDQLDFWRWYYRGETAIAAFVGLVAGVTAMLVMVKWRWYLVSQGAASRSRLARVCCCLGIREQPFSLHFDQSDGVSIEEQIVA